MDVAESRAALTAEGLHAAGLSPAPLLMGSVDTVDDLVAAIAEPGTLAVAEQVAAGLGAVPPVPSGAALWISVVVDSEGASADRLGWLPLATALAIVDALRQAARVPAETLWPDGLTVPGAMCGGDAGTRSLGSVAVHPRTGTTVVTVGLLVSVGMLELPPRTTSVYADGGAIDRAALVAAYDAALAGRLDQWRRDDPVLRSDYRGRCQTMGRLVVVDEAQGRVRGLDDAGRLVVATGGGDVAISSAGPVPSLV